MNCTRVVREGLWSYIEKEIISVKILLYIIDLQALNRSIEFTFIPICFLSTTKKLYFLSLIKFGSSMAENS